jgi:phospholipase C
MAAILKTWDQRAVSVQRNDDGTVRLTADGGPPAILHLLTDEEGFAIRLSWDPEYLSMDGAAARISPTVGLAETFELVAGREANAFGIRNAGNGRHLSTGPDPGAELTLSADDVGDRELFTFDRGPVEGADAPATCCCGPSVPKSGAVDDKHWDDQTHRHIVELAVYLLAEMKDPTAEAKWVVEQWRAGHWKGILDGLKGADYWPEWMPVIPPWNIYYFHFYDPESGGSWAFPRFQYPRHAVDLGQVSFDTSLRLLREGSNLYEAYVHLGISLHYLTDLCQPMHAANFTNGPLVNDWRHAAYEQRAEIRVHHENFFQRPHGYPALDRSEIEGTSTAPSDWLRTVARQSYATWKAGLEDEVKRKDLGWGRFENSWGAEAEPSFKRSLWLAPRNAARYLCIWAYRAM